MKRIKKIFTTGITISILLLLIGGVYAEDDAMIAPDTSIEDTNNSNTIENVTLEEGGAVSTENITLEDEGIISTEKKSSPGFGSIVTLIMFLSVIIMARRR